jgi:transcriptional regulator with XRE-family HTH domain
VSAPETVTHSTDADEFSPERLQDFQDKHGLTVTEIARRLGVSKDSWRNWTEGRCYPGRPNTIAALRELLGEVTRKSNVPEAAAVKGGKHQLAATAVHEIANNFHARYQAKMDDILVDNVISHVCETENVERTKLRRETALVIFLLKDRMSMQEIYQRLSGHSS